MCGLPLHIVTMGYMAVLESSVPHSLGSVTTVLVEQPEQELTYIPTDPNFYSPQYSLRQIPLPPPLPSSSYMKRGSGPIRLGIF